MSSMKLKIVIVDFEIPLRVKKWGVRIGIPAAILLGGGTIAWAAGLHTWSQGDPLTAADLNGNFTNLDGRLAAVEGEVHPASAFRAEVSQTTTITPSTNQAIIFDHTLFDVGSEYDHTTGVFSPKRAGTYLLTCGLQFTSSAADFAVIFLKNGTLVANHDEAPGAGAIGTNPTNPQLSVVLALAASDVVKCGAYTNASTSQSLGLSFPNYFSAVRLN
jgi:hypothetical protein